MVDAINPSPLSLTCDEFAEVFAGRVLGVATDGRPLGGKAGALDAYRRFFREGKSSFGVAIPPVVHTLREESPEGEVIKFLTKVDGVGRDGLSSIEIESVLIPMIGSAGVPTYTLCVSSQVGCAMGCTFCETAQMGLIRSLSAAEIVAQWWNATHIVGIRPKNIVFMGMGEPMDNLDNVLQAVAILKGHNGPHVAISQITISTVGRVDGIRRLAAHVEQPGWHRLGLALSLNAPNDADRSAIMPVNRKWNLKEVQDALLDWPTRSGNKVCVEYVMIPGVNDSRAHAEQIAEFMRPFGLLGGGRIAGQKIMAMLNLIPYNPRRDSPWPAPTEERANEFLGWLQDLGVFAKRRRTKGREMMGACGQLGAAHIRRRQIVTPTVSIG